MKVRFLLILTLVLFFFPLTGHAEWERTVSAWDTRLPDKGRVQVTFWGGYWETGFTSVDLEETSAYLDITYGISDNWSVALSPSYYSWSFEPGPSDSGISDTTLMTTYRFMDEDKSGFDMAVQGNLYIPTGDADKGLGSDRYSSGVTLLASRQIGPFIGVANLGGNVIIDAREEEKDVVGHAVLEGVYPLSEQLSLNMALSGSTKRFDAGEESADIGVGFRCTPKAWNMFLAAMVYNSFTSLYDWGLNVAVGYEF
jgi:hypothetical protein